MDTAAPSTPTEAAPQPAVGLASAVVPQLGASAAESFVPPGGVLYKVDSSRATFAELWRDCRPSTVWIAWIAKLMGTRLPGSVNDPNVESLRPFSIDESAAPPDVRPRVAPMLRDLASLGFDAGPPACYAIIDLFNNSRTWMFCLPRQDGRAVARVVFRREGSRAASKTHVYCEIISSLDDGGFLWSTSAKATLWEPPEMRVRRRRGASPAELWAAHERELVSPPLATGVRPAVGRDAAEALLERHHLLVRDFHLRRRLFTPMTPADQKVAASVESAYASASNAGFAYPDVMAELERLQNRTSSRFGGVAVLVVSILAFLAIGVGGNTGALASRDAREFLLLLVGILFFHEMGHYLAMRVFRYRNVRMFFIPLFGAAVSGTHYSAPGWKKVIVALMGPLPGILVGAGLGLAGMWLHQPLMIKAALLALILNGMNLLPILPLDGGRVVQSLVFARHYAADAVFRGLAGAALIALSFLPGSRILLYLGLAMLLSVPLAWRRGRIAAGLRRDGLQPAPSNEQRIPADVARQIITRLTGGGPGAKVRQSSRLVAQNTLAVYELLCSRPPGWAATLGLGTAHVLAIVLALAVAIVLGVAQGGPFARFARAAANAPRQTLSPDDIVSSGDRAPTTPRKTIIANFAKPADARAAFLSLARRAKPGEAVERFGQTVLIAFPATDDAARREHLAAVEALTRDFSVDVPDLPTASFRLTCIAPDAARATELEAEINEYLHVPAASFDLIPPWSPLASAPGVGWPQRRLARQTYLRLLRAGLGGGPDPGQKEMSERIRDAFRRGDTAESKRLAAEQRRRFQDRRRHELDRLRALHDGSLDPVVVENFPAPSIPTDPEADVDPDDGGGDVAADAPRADTAAAAANRAIAARMGQVPLLDGKPAPGALRFSSSGFVTREGLLLSFRYWTFEDDVEGAPALVHWLAQHGCKAMRYEFRGPSGNPLE